MSYEDVDWIQVTQVTPLISLGEHGNEISCSITGGKFLD